MQFDKIHFCLFSGDDHLKNTCSKSCSIYEPSSLIRSIFAYFMEMFIQNRLVASLVLFVSHAV